MYNLLFAFSVVILLSSCATPTKSPMPTALAPIEAAPTIVPPSKSPEPPPLAPWAGSTENMVLIPEGCFLMGWAPLADRDWPSGDMDEDETPVHEVCLDAFYIDEYEVTNWQFMEFVKSTGYVTTAETAGESRVLDPAGQGVWGYGWSFVTGAYWEMPQGPGSSIEDKMDHPVVHVSWDDAVAFAAWAGKRLPTEAEWEKAARGMLNQNIFTWGMNYEEFVQRTEEQEDWGLHMNYHGDIRKDEVLTGDLLDGYEYTSSPVGSFPPNGYGLFDMAGNVYEYVNDWYDPTYYLTSPVNNPLGPENTGDRTIRGGAWSFCECEGRPASRRPATEFSNDYTGFRLAMDAE